MAGRRKVSDAAAFFLPTVLVPSDPTSGDEADLLEGARHVPTLLSGGARKGVLKEL